MRILVTGAAGFIGSHIANELIKEHEVWGIDDESGGTFQNVSPDVIACYIDLADDLETLEAVVEINRPDVIYHLAANAREGASFFQPISVVRRNTMAYTNVITAAIKYNVKRIILFSSMAIYGNQQPPFCETMEARPVDIYGLQKANMEAMTKMLAASHGIEYVIIRPHNVFGKFQCLNDIHRNVLAIWMNKIARGEPVTIYGDGQQKRALSYIGNSLPAFIKAMDAPNSSIFNIGGGWPLAIVDLAQMTIEAMGEDSATYPIEYLPDRHAEVRHAYTCHERAERELGFREDTEEQIMEGILNMAEWARPLLPQGWATTDKLEIPKRENTANVENQRYMERKTF
jgi:UDP-glucose 4-epimerase